MGDFVVYVPGLGGARADTLQRNYVNKHWNNRDPDNRRDVIFFESQYETLPKESNDDKLGRLIGTVESVLLKGEVDVVAVSAGGALATQLLAKVPGIRSAKLICPKVRGSNTIGEDYQSRAPALLDAVRASENLLANLSVEALYRTTVYRPFYDGTVPLDDMIVPGAEIKRIPMVGHIPSIAVCLAFSMP